MLTEENVGVKRRYAEIRALKRWRVTSTVVTCTIQMAADRHKAAKRRAHQIIAERIFLASNFALEVPSAIFDQLSSEHKAQYVLTAMLISFATLLICISKLVYRGRKAGVALMWRQKIPWLYYPSPGYRAFGNFTDVVGLLSATFQCIFTAIAYILFCRCINNLIQISIMPLVFAFCLPSSKFRKNSDDNITYSIVLQYEIVISH